MNRPSRVFSVLYGRLRAALAAMQRGERRRGAMAAPAPSTVQSRLPRPAALEPAVHFWIRVYSEITTDAGFIHDQQNLSIIYETP